jgi:4-hydroxybenzoate polyprenyltransferase
MAESESKSSAADVAFGYAAPTERSLINQVIGLITLQRIAVVVFFFPAVAAAAALAGVRFNDPRFIILLGVTWLIGAASHFINDLVDRERDKSKWPLRPLPTGLISKPAAALYAALLIGTGLLVTILVFNGLAVVMVLLIITSGYVYARYARENVGYLTVLVPCALIPVTAWIAISPETIITPLPWLLAALMSAIAVAGNIANEASDKVVAKALFVQFKPRTEMVLYAAGVICTLVVGITIIYYAQLSWACVVVLIAVIAWALTAVKYLGSERSPETLKKAFMTVDLSGAIFFLSLAVFAWLK